jgi:hypothetical protein
VCWISLVVEFHFELLVVSDADEHRLLQAGEADSVEIAVCVDDLPKPADAWHGIEFCLQQHP